MYSCIEFTSLADDERIPVPGQVPGDGCHGREGAHVYTRLSGVVPPGAAGFRLHGFSHLQKILLRIAEHSGITNDI